MEGRSGGLALLWKNVGDFNLSSLSKNHIDGVVSIEGREDWRLTGFYGEPNRRLRWNTWNLLRLLNHQSSLPWCIIGDMNNITSQEDKKGGRRYPEWLIKGFCEVISECNLIDLDLLGNPFTWEKSRGTSSWVEIRLDRALVTQRWLGCYSEATLSNIEISTLDHSPIYLDIDKNKENSGCRRFRFENTWFREPMCRDIVLDCGESNSDLGYKQKIMRCQAKLGVWRK
ncbi:uncharacterized protein LOC141719892 [Apium graveolens]|uniref:uncharacterized protein LOC141719892 n=1 Tax=Apium graveolens TaxID=4045 RepID=UPI003D79F447